ncbi:MAG: hypothetical protein ACE1ZA_20435, partial [Pseudomonadales bacterium]
MLILCVQRPGMVAHERRILEYPAQKRIENSIVLSEPGASRNGLESLQRFRTLARSAYGQK